MEGPGTHPALALRRRIQLQRRGPKRKIFPETPLQSSQLVPKPKPSVAWTSLPGGAVLFALDSEVYYSLNQVGALIWEMLALEAADIDAICDSLHDSFPDESLQQIQSDVGDLLEEFARNGLVEGSCTIQS